MRAVRCRSSIFGASMMLKEWMNKNIPMWANCDSLVEHGTDLAELELDSTVGDVCLSALKAFDSLARIGMEPTDINTIWFAIVSSMWVWLRG